MQSCDTFAVQKNYSLYRENIFAKNSDRPLGEAQRLRFFPEADHQEGETLKCTHLCIPQVSHTYAMMGSQPYWIWGFEMGINECGLMIGNEAEGSNCPQESEDGLLGMDLLRLALERASNGREAVAVITELLETYGQNANASMLFDRRYENSFLLVDPEEIWLLETAGRQWAARQVKDWCAISNCYTIGGEYDLASKEVEHFAREHRFLASHEPMDFAKAYTKPAVRQTNAVPRWRRMEKLLKEFGGSNSFDSCKQILRDHHEGELVEPRFGAAYGTFCSICMHAMTWDAGQTVASLMGTYDEELGIVGRFAASTPCCAVYVPVYFKAGVPEALEKGGAVYEADSFWWAAERLAMGVSIDEARYQGRVQKALLELEEKIEDETKVTEAEARRMLKNNDGKGAMELLRSCTENACARFMSLAETLACEIYDDVRKEGGLYGPRKELLEEYFARVQMPV